MKNGENYNSFSRRSFVKSLLIFSIFAQVATTLQACKDKALQIIFKLSGTNHILGHRIWTKDFPQSIATKKTEVLIIGGGISGLSAARRLVKKNKTDFLVLELEKNVGGNSNFGENQFSKFPLGAHYLPLPNLDDKELLDFLHESKIITHYNNGFPVFDETQLCFDPKERLFIKNTWQQELVPKYGISDNTETEINRFSESMNQFKNEKGADNKYFFTIPLKGISSDDKYKYLDSITMQEWLIQNNFNSKDLLAYIDYCCRDDFGLGIKYVSAWAGIFYFAARKYNSFYSDAVLTWPEGNGRLKQHLEKFALNKTKTQQLVFDIKTNHEGVLVKVFDEKENQTITYQTNYVICCTPSYITRYLVKEKKDIATFEYAPWFTATITLNEMEFNDEGLCWDNVIHEGKGLGYIYNQHQSLAQIQKNKVLTYYHSFSTDDSKKARKRLYKMSENEIKDIVLQDLQIAHPNINESILEIEIYKIGHGMISPKPGFLFGTEKMKVQSSIENKIYFAHSDLSGISIFEEAFHQGIDAVNQILKHNE